MSPNSTIARSLCLVLYLVLLSLAPGHISAYNGSGSCPQACQCTGRIVNCTGSNQPFVPENLPIWTEILVMTNNPLETLVARNDRLIVTPNKLIQLDFTNTNLRNVKSEFLQHLFNDAEYIDTSLQSLTFDHNFLTTIPLVNYATNLRTLSLIGNKVDNDSIADVDISIYPMLETLDLSDNLIGHIPRHFLSGQSLQPYRKLTTLILHNNRIDLIEPAAFDLFVNLKVLKLSRNNIAVVVSDWLCQLGFLKELDLNSNRIELLGTLGSLAFNGSKSLEVLKLRRNRLNNLSDGSFYGLSKLQKLNLDHNNVSDIRLGWTYGMTSLTELTLRHNSIKDIHSGVWSATPKLAELYLNHNQLERIEPDTFSGLSYLKVLKLSNNRISFIDENVLHTLTSMENLDLSDNQLSWAFENSNGFFASLRSLKKLRLDNNEIRHIHNRTFSGPTDLTLLSLSGNPITSIESNSFSWFPNLNELHLENTDFMCDCSLKWFYKWLQLSEIRRQFAIGMRCKHPKQLYLDTENSLLDANIEEFLCQDYLKPRLIDDFKGNPKPISAIKGKNMTFYCKVVTSSEDQLQFKWIKDTEVIDHTHKRVKLETLASAFSGNASLYTNVFTLVNVSDEDQGSYQCMASNNYASVYSDKFQVNVHVIPYFTKKPEDLIVKVGTTALLECAATGQPAPHISLYKNGKTNGTGRHNFPAAFERRIEYDPSKNAFMFTGVTKDDMGTYTCNATNDAGTVLSTASLNVVEPPSFVRKTGNKEGVIGTSVSLECMAAGIPMPKITWFKNGVKIDQTARHFFTAENQLLIIVKSNPSDEGQYSCSISNVYGSDYNSFFLKMQSADQSPVAVLAPPDSVPIQKLFGYPINQDIIVLLALLILLISVICLFMFCIFVCRRRNPKNQFSSDNTQDVENSNNQDDEDPDYEHSRFGQIGSVNMSLYPKFTEIGYQDCNSEDSEKDTGIEGSCKSSEDETEQMPYSYTPNAIYQHPYHYQSLPRQSFMYQVNPNTHMSLPRNQHHHYQPQNRVLQMVEQFDSDQFVHNTLSTKEKRLVQKRLKDQQISLIKQNVPDHNTRSVQLKSFPCRSLSVNDIPRM